MLWKSETPDCDPNVFSPPVSFIAQSSQIAPLLISARRVERCTSRFGRLNQVWGVCPFSNGIRYVCSFVADPVPGGCNIEFNFPIDPNIHTWYDGFNLWMEFQYARGEGVVCEDQKSWAQLQYTVRLLNFEVGQAIGIGLIWFENIFYLDNSDKCFYIKVLGKQRF